MQLPPLSGMLSAALFFSNFQVGGIGVFPLQDYHSSSSPSADRTQHLVSLKISSRVRRRCQTDKVRENVRGLNPGPSAFFGGPESDLRVFGGDPLCRWHDSILA